MIIALTAKNNSKELYIYQAPDTEIMRDLLISAAKELNIVLHFNGPQIQKEFWQLSLLEHNKTVMDTTRQEAQKRTPIELSGQPQEKPSDEVEVTKAELEPLPSYARIASPAITGAQNNNCFFHALTHQLLAKQNFIENLTKMNEGKIWRHFTQSLIDIYGEQFKDFEPSDLQNIKNSLPNPIDREHFFGPVFRKCYQYLFGHPASDEVTEEEAYKFASRFGGQVNMYINLAPTFNTEEKVNNYLDQLKTSFKDLLDESDPNCISVIKHDDKQFIKIKCKRNERVPDLQIDLIYQQGHWNFSYQSDSENNLHNEMLYTHNRKALRPKDKAGSLLHKKLFKANKKDPDSADTPLNSTQKETMKKTGDYVSQILKSLKAKSEKKQRQPSSLIKSNQNNLRRRNKLK